MPWPLHSSLARHPIKCHNYHYEHTVSKTANFKNGKYNEELSGTPVYFSLCEMLTCVHSSFKGPSLKHTAKHHENSIPSKFRTRTTLTLTIFDLLYQLKEQFPVMNISKFPRFTVTTPDAGFRTYNRVPQDQTVHGAENVFCLWAA
jgi:hypothetical protein